ncbi:hypothetical protein CK203_087548 [Vitis vinifera]|uniref:DUF4219 domain-containing protein n=1 Tax=Vitis vinifera TaxID=29760 RepID=A0A438DAB0_VITVI|nr:hypothetical protein CK203_087548 [Vitis vinifera]
MEPHQEGASIGRPPFLTSENYSHWKVRMQYFLKMQSEKVWNAVEFGWSPPKVLDREGRPTNVIKLSWNGIEVIMKLVRTMLEPCILSLMPLAQMNSVG